MEVLIFAVFGLVIYTIGHINGRKAAEEEIHERRRDLGIDDERR